MALADPLEILGPADLSSDTPKARAMPAMPPRPAGEVQALVSDHGERQVFLMDTVHSLAWVVKSPPQLCQTLVPLLPFVFTTYNFPLTRIPGRLSLNQRLRLTVPLR